MRMGLNTGLWVAAALVLTVGTGPAAAERMSAAAFQEAAAEISAYTIVEGENRHIETLEAIDAAVIASQGDAALRGAYAEALARLVADKSSAIDAKWFAARQLYRIAGPEQVAALAPLLTEPATSDLAIYALEHIPGDEATQALLDAFGKTEGRVRVGIINALATRGDPAALPLLAEVAPLLPSAGSELYEAAQWEEVRAALNAITAIGGSEARAIINARLEAVFEDANRDEAPRGYFQPYMDAWLALAQQAERAGAQEEALRLYMAHDDVPAPLYVRAARLHGVMRNAVQSAEVVIQLIIEAPQRSFDLYRGVIWAVQDDAQLAVYAEHLPRLPMGLRPAFLEALGERGVPEVADYAATMATGENLAMRLAGIRALKNAGGPNQVPALVTAATSESYEEAGLAREVLAAMPSEGVNEALERSLRDPGARARIVALQALEARYATGSLPAIWNAAEDSAPEVRSAAFRALSSLGAAADAERLALASIKESDQTVREAAAAAMVAVARRTDMQGPTAQVMLRALEQDVPEGAYALAVATLGKLDDPAALPVLIAAVRSPRMPIQLAAVRAFTTWPTAAPLDPLLEVAETVEDPTIRVLALRAAIGMVDHLPDNESKVAAFERAMALEFGSPEKRMILAGLAKLSGADALALAQSFLGDETIRSDAELAISRIRANLATPSASHNNDEAGRALDGDPETRWSTGMLQHPDQWFQIDFAEPVALKGLVLDAAGSAGDYPRGYAVRVSDDGEAWGEPVATGAGSEGVTRIAFAPLETRHVRIEQTSTDDAHFWSIHALEIVIDE